MYSVVYKMFGEKDGAVGLKTIGILVAAVYLAACAPVWKGFTKEQTADWMAAGYTQSEADIWWQYGFAPSEADQWRYRVSLASDAREWANAGVKPEDVDAWAKGNWKPSMAAPWVAAGWSHDEAVPWYKLGVEKAIKWRAAGFDPTSAQEWIKADVPLEKAVEWKKSGMPTAEAIQWAGLRQIKTPDDAARWKAAGFTRDSAVWWITAEYSLESAKKWKAVIDRACPDGVLSDDALYGVNPYDTKGRCYDTASKQLQLISRTRALYEIDRGGDAPLYFVNTGSKSAPQYFTGVVKGRGTTTYTTAIGAQRTVPDFDAVFQHEPQ